MNKKISVSVTVAISLISMAVTFAITMLISMRIFDGTVSNVMQKQVLNNKISEIDRFVRGNFYGTVDEEYLQDRTAKGYIDGLKSVGSTYYNATEYAELQDLENEKISGIGVEIIKDANGYYKIAKVYPDSPAALAKIEEGGYISTINDVDTKTFATVSAVQSALSGSPGTVVDIAIRDEQNSENVNYQVQRTKYTSPTIESSIVDGISYIRINTFASDKTATEFSYAITEAQEAGVVGIIFDVRNNSTGTNEAAFTEACQMVSRVSPLGSIGYYVPKNNTKKSFPTSDSTRDIDVPMVVLVNGSTGGASELFALGLQDLAGAQIAGTQTMGKFLMLSTPQRLSDGSAVSIPIGQVYPANGKDYNTVGISPDIEITVTADESNPYKIDTLRDIQILRGFEVLRGMAKNAGLTVPDIATSSANSTGETVSGNVAEQVDEVESAA